MITSLRIAFRLFKNEIKYKSIAKTAKRVLSKRLKEEGWSVHSIQLVLGLGTPDQLACIILLETDDELGRFESADQNQRAANLFRQLLLTNGYPSDFADKISVAVYSWETVKKAGGLDAYLK